MDFRLLGPLEVESGGRVVRIAGAKERTLLALLLFRANRPVSRELLIDELWGERPPATAKHTLEAYVSRLRRALAAAGDGELIESRPGGYRIRLEGEQLDVFRFERLLAEGQSALACGDPEQTEEKLAAALALWRGDVLADLALEPFAAEVGRLEELRLAAVEGRLAAALALGRHAEVVGELRSLVARHPLREGLRRQLMLALYRSGRQAEALDVYQEGRRRLVDELGIEPGRELQELQQAILRHDPALDLAAPATEVPVSRPAAEPPVAAAPALVREQRKVVTVLFCDVSESTALGERLDPEALRALLARYFERMRAIVERHGGTVEKFIGDAVMAVFGVPLLHEDDALRACRAAVEMRDALPELGVGGRIGIATGEVVTGSEERLVTGAAVNLAARLEQAAEPGEIVVSAETLRLVGAVVEVESIAPLRLKGLAEPVPAHRLLAVSAEAPPRLLETPIVGRETELRRLEDVFAQAVHDRSCQLFTVLGAAGIGKSRLAAELLAGVDARVVQARCLPYGEGITYWPVVEILRQLRIRPSEEAAAAAIAALLGESERPTSPEEIAWAFRKTLEQAASGEPLVCVLDDLHWGEPALLDLVEHSLDWTRDAPILLLCLARPELLDDRPNWAGGKLNSTTVLLEPLSRDETEQLIEQLLDGQPVAEGVRRRVVEVAEGNPLFAEEMLALAREHGDGELAVPPSIQALLAARLDQLDPRERAVLEGGAVEGEIFHRGALQALVPEEQQMTAQLATLVRKGLIGPDAPEVPGEEGFRFRHLLLRDAAYDALAKESRAELHERFGYWLEGQSRSVVELDEILGYHLERACRYRAELGLPERGELRAAARARLTAASERAYARGDMAAVVSLGERALALVPAGEFDVTLEATLQSGLYFLGRGGDALRRARALAERAAATGDRIAELCGRMEHGIYHLLLAPEGATEELAALVEQALPELRAAGDDAALSIAYRALAQVANMNGQMDAEAEAYGRAAEHTQGTVLRHFALGLRAGSLFYGTTPASELLASLDDLRARGIEHDYLDSLRARTLALLGRFEEARAIMTELHAKAAELGGAGSLAHVLHWFAEVELWAGNPAAAAERGEQGTRLLDELGERGVMSTAAGDLAQALYELDRLDEAEAWAARAAEAGASDDVITEMLWRQVRAKLLARRGEHAEAERLAQEAVALAEKTDMLSAQGDAYADLGEVLLLAGRPEEAVAALEQALARYERKENLPMAARTQARLAALPATTER